MREAYPNELYHHGILGQKWGKKNGPPYPLDAADHSSAEKKAGWKKSLDSDAKRKYKRGEQFDDDKNDSSVTRRVKKDYNSMSDKEFSSKYKTTKNTYRRRVNKYGDPYMNSPLAIKGKQLAEKQKQKNAAKARKVIEKFDKKIAKADADVRSFDPIIDGFITKSGRVCLSKEDVANLIKYYSDVRDNIIKEKEAYIKKQGKAAELLDL